MHQIKSGIYYEDAYLGVTLGALSLPYGTILIDAPLRPEDSRAWRSSLISMRSGVVRLLISLDAHLDRTLGARAMDCTIISHQQTAQVFRNRPTIFKGQGVDTGSEWETYMDVIGTRWASPDITFTDNMMLHWGGTDVILEHHPGSAPGAIWVIIPEEKVMFVGDAITPNQPPFLANANLETWLESLDMILKDYKDFTIISGRGGPVGMSEVKEQIRYLKVIDGAINRMARRNPPPESTEKMIPRLLKRISFPQDQYELYAQRLRAGLYQYYTHRYLQLDSPDHSPLEEEES